MKLEKNKDLIIEILIDSNCLPFFDKCYFFDKDGFLSDLVNIKINKEFPVCNFVYDELLKNEIYLEFRDFDTMNKNNRKNEIESIIYKLRDENALDNNKHNIEEKLEQIINMENIEQLDEEYNILINKYNLYDKLEEEHQRIKIIYQNIIELQKQDNDKSIDINTFNEKGKKICKIINSFKDIKIDNMNVLLK